MSWDYSNYILAVTLVLCWVIELSLLLLKKDLSPQVCAESKNWAYRSEMQAVTLVPGCAIEMSLLLQRKGYVTLLLSWSIELNLQHLELKNMSKNSEVG